MTAVVFAVPKWVATAAKALFGKATGNVIVVCLEKYIHCRLGAFGETNHVKYPWFPRRFAFITIQCLCWGRAVI